MTSLVVVILLLLILDRKNPSSSSRVWSNGGSDFHIRTARKQPSDAIFIAEAFDSSFTHLASIGSELQWGSKKKTSDPTFISSMEQFVTESNVEGSGTALYIAEKAADEKPIRCGAALVMSSILPDYVKECSDAMSILSSSFDDGDITDFDYLCILVADRRVHELSRGVGSFLIQHVILQARRNGRRAILVDCWDGNNRLLVDYYRKQGFRPIAGLNKMGKHIDNVMWTGMLLRLDL